MWHAGRKVVRVARSVNVERGARVVVVGAGFAGASLLRHLPPVLRRPGETLLIDRRDEYTFAPLIHEVAVGRVHPESVTSPIAPACAGSCEFLNAEVSGIDLDQKILETAQGPMAVAVDDFPDYAGIPSADERLARFVLGRAHAVSKG